MFQKDYRTNIKRFRPVQLFNMGLKGKTKQFSISLSNQKLSLNKSNQIKLKQPTLRKIYKQLIPNQNQIKFTPLTSLEGQQDGRLNYLSQKKYNPYKIKLNSNLSKEEKTNKLYLSCKKQKNNQIVEYNNSNAWRSNLATKSPQNIFEIANETSLSVSVKPMEHNSSTDTLQVQQQALNIQNPDLKINYLHKSNTPKSLRINQKQNYFRKKPFNEDYKLIQLDQKQFQLELINKLDSLNSHQFKNKDRYGKLEDKVELCNQKIKNYRVNKKLHDQQLWYAESFKGRRPYNQDRYICLTNKQLNVRQKLMKITHKFGQVTNILDNNNPTQTAGFNSNYCLFGVFDGHGGSRCSQFLKQNFHHNLSLNRSLFTEPQQAIRQTFLKLQQKFLALSEKSDSLQTSGSCAVICMIKNNKIMIGNVGDSRALLLGQNLVNQITNDHKPDEKQQKMRIIRNGGKLYKDGSTMGLPGKQNIRVFNQTRIMPGSLNVSRTIGDIEVKYKKYGGSPGIVVPIPDIFVETIDKQYDHVLLASDGLFEGLSNNQIHQIYKKTINDSKNQDKQIDESLKIFVKQLITKSYQKSSDNITVVCIKIPKQQI